MAGIATLAVLGATATLAGAQTEEVKEKPRLYTYESQWTFPRAHWGDVAKDNAQSDKVLAAAVANGSVVGYGNDEYLVHTADGFTHDNWWQSMSMAGLMSVLETFYKSPTTTSPLLVSATKHADQVLVSRYYNWKSGSWKNAYGHSSLYKFKSDAPNNALNTLSRTTFVPLLEKLLANGAIVEYEIDEEAIHTDSQDRFWIYYIAPDAAGLDKVNDAISEAVKGNPLIGPAIGSMLDSTAHRDSLLLGTVTYK
jgi:hypothetical protein